MANYATNLFFASTENEADLEKVEKFLDENFEVFQERTEEFVEAEFESRWDYPENLINELISSLEKPNDIYIRVLCYELCNEYVTFRTYSQGEWDIKY